MASESVTSASFPAIASFIFATAGSESGREAAMVAVQPVPTAMIPMAVAIDVRTVFLLSAVGHETTLLLPG
jgi:hypothetical protein